MREPNPEGRSGLRERAEALLRGVDTGALELSSAQSQELVHDLRVYQAELELQNEELKRTRDALEASRERLSELFNQAPVGYVTLDAAGIILEVNDTFSAMVGRPRAELVRRPLADLVEDEDRPVYYARLGGLLKSPTTRHLEVRIRRVGGAGFHALLRGRVRPRAVVSGGAPGSGDAAGRELLVTVSDVSQLRRSEEERRELELQLLQAQKMEAVGQLAGGVAHDLSNMLTPILMSADLLLQDLPAGGGDLIDKVETIRAAARRARDLTTSLLAHGRRQVLDLRARDLNLLVASLHRMLRSTLREDVELDVRLARGRLVFEGDAAQLEHVIVNLAVNAQDAMPRGGRLVVETRALELDEHEAARLPEAAPGPYVALAVEDDGCGMDAGTLAHIFEPFFTTKERGRGSGLGLATVYGIVRQHGGTVRVRSSPGGGSRFEVLLPAVSGHASVLPAEEAALSGGSPGGDETILLVEDDDDVRACTEALLRSLGYRVVAAEDGLRACGLAAAHEGPIDLLLTDIVMPKMRGREVYERLAEQRPGLKVLFMTGYSDELLSSLGAARGPRLIRKPFTSAELAAQVRHVIDGKP